MPTLLTRHSQFVILFLFVLPWNSLAEDKLQDAGLTSLQGSWTAIEAEIDGTLIEDAAFWREKKTLKLTDTDFKFMLADGTHEGFVRIKTEADPKQITFVTKRGPEFRGIYKLDDTLLTVCWSIWIEDKSMPERPRGFDSRMGEIKFVFKRDESPAPDKPQNAEKTESKKTSTQSAAGSRPKSATTQKARTAFKQLMVFKDEKTTKEFWSIEGKADWRIQNDGIRFGCGNRVSGALRSKHEFAGDFLFEIKATLGQYGAAHIAMFGEKIEFGGDASKPVPIQVQVQRKDNTLFIKKNGKPMTIQLKDDWADKASGVGIYFGAWDNRGTSMLINSIGTNAESGTLREAIPEKGSKP